MMETTGNTPAFTPMLGAGHVGLGAIRRRRTDFTRKENFRRRLWALFVAPLLYFASQVFSKRCGRGSDVPASLERSKKV
jgi:hypothetical protein